MMAFSIRSGVSYLSRALKKKDGSIRSGPNADSGPSRIPEENNYESFSSFKKRSSHDGTFRVKKQYHRWESTAPDLGWENPIRDPEGSLTAVRWFRRECRNKLGGGDTLGCRSAIFRG